MTKFQLRKVEVNEGREAMLFKAGWKFDGPDKHKDTELGKYWINPRSQRRYTMEAAVGLEELREAADYGDTGVTAFSFREMKHVRKHKKKKES